MEGLREGGKIDNAEDFTGIAIIILKKVKHAEHIHEKYAPGVFTWRNMLNSNFCALFKGIRSFFCFSSGREYIEDIKLVDLEIRKSPQPAEINC